MSHRDNTSSPPSSPRPTKRQRAEHLTSESFKNGVMLAPMVRSGALPTRLYALKHGAKLVWSPEIVDKAILHAKREVDPATGVISYNGVSKAIFTTHPIEKPYLVYQIGSADPDLAVQAAKTVLQDVSGIDLNCGCPKPFSTHAGMGAALLTNPDLLCLILTELRRELPPEITVSAKIRLLPDQGDTLHLVERIINTGISNLTVHCRTRNMRPRERALVERLREIVEFVERTGKGVSVIENGDCVDREHAIQLRDMTGAHSCMIATAAESNPTVFSPEPHVDLLKTLTPSYIRLCKYLGNHFSNTKFSVMNFKGILQELKKADRQRLHDMIVHAKSYEDLDEFVGRRWDGGAEMRAITERVAARETGNTSHLLPPPRSRRAEEVHAVAATTAEPAEATEEKENKILISSTSTPLMIGALDMERSKSGAPLTPPEHIPSTVVVIPPSYLPVISLLDPASGSVADNRADSPPASSMPCSSPPDPSRTPDSQTASDSDSNALLPTPLRFLTSLEKTPERDNAEPASALLCAPRLPVNETRFVRPAFVTGVDVPTPTPTPVPTLPTSIRHPPPSAP